MAEKEIDKKIEVQTLAEDMAKVIEGSEGDFIKKIIHEQEDKKIGKKFSAENKKRKLFILLGSLLLIIALGFFVWLLFLQKEEEKEINSNSSSFVFFDQNVFLPVDDFGNDKIMQMIFNQSQNTSIRNNGVEAIYLTLKDEVISLRNFFKIIDIENIFQKNDLVYDNFLLGTVNKENKDLFILISMRSIQDIFPDMRNWENKIFRNLHPLWNLEINSETAYLFDKNFEDGIIQNKNARILYNNENEIVLMYVFLNENFLIITQKEATVQEIIGRLSGSKIKK